MNIHQRIEGSWAHHDAVRHYMYESIYGLLETISWENRPYRLVEIGSSEPTSSPIRMVTHLIGDRCKPEVGNWPEVDIQNMPYDPGSIDILVADQVLEHVQRPWVAAEQIWRAVKIGGLVIIATPYLHPIHPAPLDCWRISPDGYDVLFESYLWETVGRGSWGNRQICQEIYASEVSRGMTGNWVPYNMARQLIPSFDTPPDNLHPVVLWAVYRKR